MRFTFTTGIAHLRDMIQNADIAEAKLKTLLNLGNTRTRTLLGIHKMRESKSFIISDTTTHANKYFLAPWASKPVAVTINVSGTSYPVLPVESQIVWDAMLATNTSSDQPTRFLYENRAMSFFPTPSAERTVTVLYEKVEKELSNADYTTGTVNTLENNTKLVKLQGSTLSSWMIDAWLKVDTNGYWYRIANIDTTLDINVTLEQEYLGTTINAATAAADRAFTVGEQFDLPEELHEAPLHRAAMQYFKFYRRDPVKRKEHKNEFDELIALGRMMYKNRTGIKVQQSKIRGVLGAIDPNDYPSIPTTDA